MTVRSCHEKTRVGRSNPCASSAIQDACSIPPAKPSEGLPAKLGHPRTSNMIPRCQACFLESTECFQESTLGTCQSHPPPCRLMSQVGKRVARHARLQSRASKSQHHATGGGPRLPRRSSKLAAVCEFISLAPPNLRQSCQSCISFSFSIGSREPSSSAGNMPTQQSLCRHLADAALLRDLHSGPSKLRYRVRTPRDARSRTRIITTTTPLSI